MARIAEALVEKALGGYVQAIREIGDRLDGKPAQAVKSEGCSHAALGVVLVPMKSGY